jgi:two-component system LytT family sensor kinase
VRARAEQALRERMARRYDQARLQALRVQTHPHFLFNSLSAIAGLIRSEPDAAEAMVTRLGDLFRATLGNRDTEYVTLARELDLGTQYLEIQRTRFGDRFDFRIDCEPAAAEAAIPPLLLQPLLENAAEHGLSGQDGRIVVDVVATLDSERVRILVRNHAASDPDRQRNAARGFGLENVRERLHAAFGDDAELEAEHMKDGYFEARIHFPMRPASHASARS